MLFLNESDVRQLLPMPEAIRQMRLAFEQLADGRGLNQPRRRLVLPAGSVLHSMAGAYGGYFGTKVYATNPRHGASFLFLLYRAGDAAPLALFEAGNLGQIRTGAVTGLATEIMARPNARTLALIGSGFQARSQLEAVLAVRPIRSVRVWSRNAGNREKLAEEASKRFGLKVEPALSAELAVREADIIVTATSAKEPVLEAGWVAPGTHVNAIGSNQASRRELPAELIAMAELIAVDSIEQARQESGDLLLALEKTGWEDPKMVELTELVAGKPGKRTPEGAITIFKSNGIAIEDVAAAAYAYEAAQRSGAGRDLPIFHS